MPYILRPGCIGNKTLVGLKKETNSGCVQVADIKSRVPKKDYEKGMKDLNLAGNIHEKIGKLKVDDKAAKKKKLKENKPITFDITDKPKHKDS